MWVLAAANESNRAALGGAEVCADGVDERPYGLEVFPLSLASPPHGPTAVLVARNRS